MHNYNFDLTFPGTEFLQLTGRTRSKAECIASLPAALSYFLLSWACKRKCVHEHTLQCWSFPTWDKGLQFKLTNFSVFQRCVACLMAAGNMSIFCNMLWVFFSFTFHFLVPLTESLKPQNKSGYFSSGSEHSFVHTSSGTEQKQHKVCRVRLNNHLAYLWHYKVSTHSAHSIYL